MRAALLVLALASAAHADNSVGSEPQSQPLLRAELSPHKKGEVARKILALRLVAPSGKLLWRHAPVPQWPEVAGRDAAAYERDPRVTLDKLVSVVFGTLTRNDALVVAMWEGLLVLDRRDGHALYDQTIAAAGFGQLDFDEAVITVECGGAPVNARARGGRFVVDCGPRLVYDNGPGIVVIDTATWKQTGNFMFPDVIRGDRFDVGGAHISVHKLK